MDHSNENLAPRNPTSASAFRRAGATVAVACAVTGSIIGLGSMGALAAPGSSTSEVAASVETPAPADAGTTEPAPKVTYTEADLAAFAASPYAADALNLAAVWGLDLETAQGKAGAKIQAGTPLPFGPGESATVDYTPDQERFAYFMAEIDSDPDFEDTVGLAVAWGSANLFDAKAQVGGLLLAHETVPPVPTTFTDDQNALAFTLAGYGDAEATQLAGLWQTDTRSAVVRAGAEILAGNDLPR
ncbi:hypothetical protein [Herbiconiux liukaitaii]|uniref:hypothetical protein n=1 Tax=Herbiconiux liukaitaii TaxID=3342799 RepID=UPI0035B9FA62